MRTWTSAYAMLLWACDETAAPAPKTSGQIAASYADKVDELERSTRMRTRWPLCTSQVPQGAPCGMVFGKGWEPKMHTHCDDKPDPKGCISTWLDAKTADLEGRYGGSAEAAFEMCGDRCSPQDVELVMMKGYNERLSAEFLRELGKLQTEGMHAVADNEAEREAAARREAERKENNRRVVQGLASGLQSFGNSRRPATQDTVQECSNSATCPYNSVCVRAANSTKGFCAAR